MTLSLTRFGRGLGSNSWLGWVHHAVDRHPRACMVGPAAHRGWSVGLVGGGLGLLFFVVQAASLHTMMSQFPDILEEFNQASIEYTKQWVNSVAAQAMVPQGFTTPNRPGRRSAATTPSRQHQHQTLGGPSTSPRMRPRAGSGSSLLSVRSLFRSHTSQCEESDDK
eukprot:m.198120 g.198120  ORF g.198120 m.198120 type:complete len:166 (+) comp18365_c0_seq2:1555-2052(+)